MLLPINIIISIILGIRQQTPASEKPDCTSTHTCAYLRILTHVKNLFLTKYHYPANILIYSHIF